VAAVAVSTEVAHSFDNGMEFFSSFGGNPVSCAIALEVLNVIRDEGLQIHATELGKYWRGAIRNLASGHAVIRQVRGHGLFFGIEFQKKNDSLQTGAVCAYIQRRLLDHHILASFDGPMHNVMLVKPPMCITRTEVDHFMQVLKKILEEDPVSI
jgi:4-aminobutyrate aminotransferase-like enzyme